MLFYVKKATKTPPSHKYESRQFPKSILKVPEIKVQAKLKRKTKRVETGKEVQDHFSSLLDGKQHPCLNYTDTTSLQQSFISTTQQLISQKSTKSKAFRNLAKMPLYKTSTQYVPGITPLT